MPNIRPYTKLKPFDWILEATSLVLIGVSWWYLLSNFSAIPETVPVHFNLQGVPDRFGDKGELFTLLYVATGLYLLLQVLGFFPQFHNIPATLTEENKEEKSRLSARMMRMINVVMCLLFLVLSVTSVYNSLNGKLNQNPWILISFIGILTAIIVFYWTKLAKK